MGRRLLKVVLFGSFFLLVWAMTVTFRTNDVVEDEAILDDVYATPHRNLNRNLTVTSTPRNAISAIPERLGKSKNETSDRSGITPLNSPVQTTRNSKQSEMSQKDAIIVANYGASNTSTPPRPTTTCRSKANLKSVWFSSRVDRSVPLFLNRVNRSVTGVAKEWWLTTMGGKDVGLDGIITKLLEVVPGKSSFHEDGKTCVSCAIVGNAGNLLGSGYGALIDSQDVIIRSNKSPIEGYEEDVGSRTTHQILYPESGIGYHRGVSLIFLPFKQRDLMWLTSIFTTKDISGGFWSTVVQLLPEAKPEDTYIIHPHFLHYIQTKWLTSEKGKWPSAGIVALLLGLHACDEVHVMGFGLNKVGRWDHYYDRREGLDSYPVKVIRHPLDLEALMRNQMKTDSLIHLYPGNER